MTADVKPSTDRLARNTRSEAFRFCGPANKSFMCPLTVGRSVPIVSRVKATLSEEERAAVRAQLNAIERTIASVENELLDHEQGMLTPYGEATYYNE